MTASPQLPASTRPLSKASLTSLICGILVCVPGLGLVAMIVGAFGFFRGKLMRGRWMAVVGTLLGLASSVGWAIFLSTSIYFLRAYSANVDHAEAAAHDFIKAAADNDIPAMHNLSVQISDDELADFSTQVRAFGGFVSAKFTDVKLNEGGGIAGVEAVVEFKSGIRHFTVGISGGPPWKVNEITIDP